MKACVGLLLLVCGLATPGCDRGEKPPATPAASPAPAPVASWTIRLQAGQRPAGQEGPGIIADEPVSMTATVTDGSGKPVSGADVEVSLKMKTMDMGDNKSKLSQVEPGVYAGKATFLMAGPWEVEVRATREGLTGIERFSYEVKNKPAR